MAAATNASVRATTRGWPRSTQLLARSIVVVGLFFLAACSGSSPTGPTATTTGDTTGQTSSTVPVSSATAHPELTYIVKAGDSLSGIAAQFDVEVEQIMELNGMTDADSIQVGQILVIAADDDVEPSGDGNADVDLLIVVDKQRALPTGYAPLDLQQLPDELTAPGYGLSSVTQVIVSPLKDLLEAATADGLDIRVTSGYRSYQEQAATFQYWIDQLGEEEAQRISAPPGHSEHQLGTAVDLSSVEVGWELIEEFGATAEGLWLSQHAHEFGFALSYPEGKEGITGYAYEPWHFRYVGQAIAESWRASGLTLLEFLELQ